MSMDVLKQILEIAKLYPVIKRVKWDGIEVEFNDKLGLMPVTANTDLGIEKERMPTEDELLMWSTGLDVDVEAKPPTTES